MGVLVVFAGSAGACERENPGFKLKDTSDDVGEVTSLSTTSVSGPTVTGDTTATSTPTSTTTEPDVTSMGPGVSGSDSTTTTTNDATTSTSSETGDTTTGVQNDCSEPASIVLPATGDTFLIDRSWEDPAPCALIYEVAGELMWEDSDVFCRDRNFGKVPALPLVDRPMQDGRDVIHYLVQFDVGKLIDPDSSEPIEFAQIKSVDLVVMVERLGPAIEVGAYPLAADQAWDAGDKFGLHGLGQASYRCRVAPVVGMQAQDCGAGGWASKEEPVPEQATPVRTASTMALALDKVLPLTLSFTPSDLDASFLDPQGATHHGFFVGLPPMEPTSTPDKVKIHAIDSKDADDPTMVVHYCPKGS